MSHAKRKGVPGRFSGEVVKKKSFEDENKND
jgi:hypothetical protein